MDSLTIANESAKDLLDAQAHVWNHMFSFGNSMALKCAIELGIPDTIQKHGKPMTLDQLATSLSLHLNKAPYLNRLMRILIHSNFFSTRILSSGEEAFELTLNSQLLLKDHPLTIAPFARLAFDPNLIEASLHLGGWLQNEDETPFHMSKNMSLWEYATCVPKFNKLFNEAMASDARFIASLLVVNNEFMGLVKGIKSLVDVGGGDGTMAKTISKFFPEMICVVFDLPHVVQGSEGYGERNIKYVGGDMFEVIPPAQAVLLKSILHDWSDDHCVKILQRCKEAIPSRDQGGRIFIIDMVVNTTMENIHYSNSQLMFDMEMMILSKGGKERTEKEWIKLFNIAGFNDYKIFTILGPRSVIEVYPS